MHVSTPARTVIHAVLSAARRPRRMRAPLGLLALISAGVGLAGCGGSSPQFAPDCPQLSLLRDAADLTQFRSGGQDLTDMVTDAQITAVPASCTYGDHGTVRSKLHLTMQITRGPAAQGRTAAVPYFVAVTDGDQVLDEQDYQMRTTFPTNVDTVTVNGEDVTLDVPVTQQKSAAAFKIYVGFRLNQDELAYNRKRGPR